MKKFIVTLTLLPLFAFAQSGELTVGEQTVVYDSATTTTVGTLYYSGDELVASEHDVVTMVYKNDRVVFEAHDTNGDGSLDAFLTLDSNSLVTNLAGEGVSAFERPEATEFAQLVANGGAGEAGAPEEDLVGDLDSITIPGSNGSMWFIIFLVIAIVLGYWYMKGKKDDDD